MIWSVFLLLLSFLNLYQSRVISSNYLPHEASSEISELHEGQISDDLIPLGRALSLNSSFIKSKLIPRIFDPLLAKGVPGNPGIKIKANQKAFDYFSTLIAPIIDREIRLTRIPPTTQYISRLKGGIQVYNSYISHYRCPQKIKVYSAAPYQLIVLIQNFDIGIIGNLVGEFNVIIPVKVSGIIHVNAQQVTARVQLGVVQSGSGAPYVQVVGCQANVGYVDAFLEDGGVIGAIANREYRHQMNAQIRSSLPGQLCSRIPEAINNKLNTKLQKVPQVLPMIELLQLLNGALALGGGSNICEAQCQDESSEETVVVNKRSAEPRQSSKRSISASYVVLKGSVQRFHDTTVILPRPNNTPSVKLPKQHVSLPPQPLPHPKPSSFKSDLRIEPPSSTLPFSGTFTDSLPLKSRPSFPILSSTTKKQCSLNPPSSFCKIRRLIDTLDISKLNDILLTTHLLQTYATAKDYIVAINGEFSQFGRGGTPFGAFFMEFPQRKNAKMIEVLISDYTINSLLFALHKKEFISITLNSNTPGIGKVLKTTCSEDEIDATEVEFQTSETESSGRHRSPLSIIPRTRRQADSVFENLGLCLGDIFPVLNEKYPHQNITIKLFTKRAPSILFYDKPKTTVVINAVLTAELYNEAKVKVGILEIEATIEADITIESQRLSGHSNVTHFQMTNPDKSLDIPQDALDKLGDLANQFFTKALNEALEKGIAIKLPSDSRLSLPFSISKLNFAIVSHALHLEFDFTIDPLIVNQLASIDTNINTCSN